MYTVMQSVQWKVKRHLPVMIQVWINTMQTTVRYSNKNSLQKYLNHVFHLNQLVTNKDLFVCVLFIALKKRIPSKICILSCFVWLKSILFNFYVFLDLLKSSGDCEVWTAFIWSNLIQMWINKMTRTTVKCQRHSPVVISSRWESLGEGLKRLVQASRMAKLRQGWVSGNSDTELMWAVPAIMSWCSWSTYTTWTVNTTLWIIQHAHHLNSEGNVVNNSACTPPEQWPQCCEQFSTMTWTLTRLLFPQSSLWQAEACMYPHWAVNAQGHKQLSDVLCHHYG